MPGSKSLKDKTAKGLFWGGLNSGMIQIFNLVFGIFLSRLLTQSDYGMVGVLAIFPALANVFLEGGFIAAIVNRKEARHEDYNALFWFNILGGMGIYGILFLAAPLIAQFNHTPELTPLARFLFLGFLFAAFGTSQTAYYFRNLMVKERAKIMISSLFISGTVSVICAFLGFGYWVLALQTVLFIGLNTTLLWVFSPWRPTLSIDFQPLKEMLPYSSKLFFTYLFNQINLNVFSVFLGRFYTMAQVGIYTQGNKWTTMGSSTIAGMIHGVAQPVLREAGLHEKERLQNVFRKMLRFTAFVSFPLMLGLGLVAEEIIVIAITDRWLESAAVVQILCIWGACAPLSTLYANLMNSLNKPQVYMWNTIALGIAQILAIVGLYRFGLHTMLAGFVTLNILWLGVWQYFARRFAGLRFTEVMQDILPFLLIAGFSIGIAWLATRTIQNLYFTLGCKIAIAALIYSFLMWKTEATVFKESIHYLLKKKPKPN